MEVDIDTVAHVLSNEKRRAAIMYGGRKDVDSFDAADVATFMCELRGEKPQGDTYNRFRTNLHQDHLPKLAEYGVLEIDTWMMGKGGRKFTAGPHIELYSNALAALNRSLDVDV